MADLRSPHILDAGSDTPTVLLTERYELSLRDGAREIDLQIASDKRSGEESISEA